MIKNLFKMIAKILVWAAVIYLVLGFIVVPLALKWGIESQATKLLKHPVQVRSVHFNPIMLSLGVNGVKVLDVDKSPMISVDKFRVDASFLALFKKVYRVESISIDGLSVDARLMSGGKINLLDLVPAAPLQPAQGSPAPAPAVVPPALPVVMVDLFTLQHGQVHFTDETVTPVFRTVIGDMDIRVTGFSTDPAGQTNVVAGAKLDEKGIVSVEGLIKPFVKPLELETALTLNSYALTVLSPYVGKYTGSELANGRFDVRMDYRISNNKLTAAHKILVQDFTFGEKVESKDALGLPFGLALALLEDANGQIKVSLPVTGDLSSPKFRYWPLVGQVARDFLFKIVTKPFSFLGSMLGAESGTDELGYVRFAPGKAEITPAEKDKLATLVRGLKERPKLRLEISGSYDPDMDWKAMQTDVLAKEYAVLKSESTDDEMGIYEKLYQRRFGVRDLWLLTNKHKLREGEYDAPKVIEEMKRQLVEKAPADKTAMNDLATARAKLVYDAVIALGLDPQKTGLGINHPAQGSMGYVPLEFTLTVFEDKVK